MSETSKSLNRPVERVMPTREGTPPLLKPGQVCKDNVHGLWHFCTPDNTLFCVGGKSGKTQTEEGRRGVSILPGPPGYAWDREHGLICGNLWTVVRGVWVKV